MVVVVTALPVLARWPIFRGSGVPSTWGFGPGRGMPFARGLQPGGVWPSRGIYAPFLIARGLGNLVFLGLLIGLGIMFYRRCYQRGRELDGATPEPSNQ